MSRRRTAGAQGPRRPGFSARGTRLLRSLRLAVLLALMSLPPALFAQGVGALSSYLRQGGTQLDFRGSNITDDDLLGLNDPVFAKVVSVLLARTHVGDRALEHLRTLRVRELDLYLTGVTDKGLEHLRGLPIERLNLTGTAISNSGLAHLKRLPLAVLVLRQTTVTSAGLVVLRDLPLRYLDLSNTAITDDGLVHLHACRELTTIDLSDTTITDQGLSDLRGIPRLTTVYVAGTRVTAAGLAAFKATRPDVQVYAERLVR